MPVYSYRCENCGVQFERQQKFSDPVLKKCPDCGKSALHKVYTPVGIVFKGSGFYATDHRSPSGSSTAHAKSEDSAAASTNTPGDAGTAKPAPASSPVPAAAEANKN